MLDDCLDTASQNFQLAQQLAYVEFDEEIRKLVQEGSFATESARRLARRALAGYFAAGVVMPYKPFAKAVEARRYDVEAIAR
ncbi:ImmA/IrrE family metallo-endopeptidase [Agrobacterium sp. CNPSo 2736]|uniref:ImmA/IrrE family metallo-endopeptidase n=1 Tax=Agrobacterium sp. CNPSo 2736 TaxID=2499627 RepID=UPI001FDF8168|nr:ImmA/IrrE family metallo-endopeptidase [Agrobacterium sp. CNPSo 2736]